MIHTSDIDREGLRSGDSQPVAHVAPPLPAVPARVRVLASAGLVIAGLSSATVVYFVFRLLEGGTARVSFGIPFTMGLGACAVYFGRVGWSSLADLIRPPPRLAELVAGGTAAALGIAVDAVVAPGPSAWVWLLVFALFFAFESLLERWLAAGLNR